MSPRPISRVLAALVAAVVAAAHVDAENMQITAAGVQLGPHVSGPALGPQGVAGHVVVLEFWGIHCGPCIASMPGLEELHKTFGPHGLLVIGAHAQGGTADDLRRAVAELGVTFTIVENASVDGGMDFNGIPHCMVFDHTGKCVYRGSPGGAHDMVAEAVKAAPAALLADRALVKLAPLAQTLKSEAMCGTVLKKARTLVDSNDGETADEAKFVVERIERRGREMVEEARSLAATDPGAAVAVAKRCVAAFKGTDIAGEAGKLLQEWAKDKEFQAAVRAGQQLARLEALEAAAKSLPGGAPAQLLSQARDIAKTIEKAWPGSAAATRAAAIAEAMSAAAATP
ncbi:MAG: TlpA family protein disulfide reductase [Planctomycetaceae bacterium]